MSRRLDEVRTSSTMMFVNVDLRVLQSPLLSGDATKMYGLFADSINTHTHVGYLSRERLAVYFGKSLRTVDRVLAELVQHKIVTAQRRFNQTSLYTVHHFDTLPPAVVASALAARAECDALHTTALDLVPDLPETDTTDVAGTVSPDVAEAAPTVSTDMAEASSPAISVDTVTPDLSSTLSPDPAHYQDELLERKNKYNPPTPEPEPLPGIGERAPTSTNDVRFVEFWKACPRRVGKADAFRKYQAAIRTGISSQTLLTAIRRYAAECRGKDPQFVVYPGTWLNQGRWDDEPHRVAPTGTDSPPAYLL